MSLLKIFGRTAEVKVLQYFLLHKKELINRLSIFENLTIGKQNMYHIIEIFEEYKIVKKSDITSGKISYYELNYSDPKIKRFLDSLEDLIKK